MSEAAVAQPGQAAQQPRSLRSLAIRGSIWTFGGYGAKLVLRLGGNLVLTRLLFPEAFGLMAVVNVFMLGLGMFSDVGIGPSIIRDKQGDDRDFLNTAWTIQTIRGAVLWLCSCLIAWPVAQFYDQPQLTQLIPVAGLSALVAGFTSTGLFSARRHLALGRVIVLELSSYSVGLICIIVWASLYRSVWAIVAGGIVGACFKMALSHLIFPDTKNRFHWDQQAAQTLYRFGKWIFLSSAVFFLSQQLDRLLLGSYVGMEALGVYSIAVLLSQGFVTLNQQLARNIAYPAIGRVFRNEPHRVQEVFYRARRALDLLFLPALGMLVAAGRHVIDILYDDRYIAAGWMLQALCIRAAMRCMLEPCESCLVALGYPRYALVQHSVRFLWVVTMIPLGWVYSGVVGVIWAVALSEIVVLPVLWYGLHVHGVLRLRREAGAWLLLAAGAAVGWIVSGWSFA